MKIKFDLNEQKILICVLQNFREARELYTQALQKVKEIYGENHPQVLK